MVSKLLIAHADGEESFAELLAEPLRQAGYEVAHRGTVLIGESVTEEASKVLSAGGPVVLCGTVKALGTGWAHRIISAARQNHGVRVFPVQMEKDAYIQQLSLDSKVALYWQDPGKALYALIASINAYYSPSATPSGIPSESDSERRYRALALESCDIIDLANLPENDRHIATRHFELRRLYVPLRVHVEVPFGSEVSKAEIDAIEKRRSSARRALLPWTKSKVAQSAAGSLRVPIGHRLAGAKRLVVLGDPGAGKTTMIRWLSTAYLLHLNQDPDLKALPDITTVPEEDWLPIVIRCRDLNRACLDGSLDDILHHTLRRTEMTESEAASLSAAFKQRLTVGKALLLVDGLDEITDPALRARFCQQLEMVCVAYPEAPVVVTSRIVGYREMGYRIGRGFEHLTVADLSMEDKNDFARRWCNLTELPERRAAATAELIQDIHSTDRIERLTGNPMLLTTMALVKRKVGRLPSRRADLYWDALEVLLNWRREVDTPLDHHEAVPQLEYVAYAMCHRGVQQLREDQIISLFENLREQYPQIHAVRKHTAEEFLRLLERRTGLLVEAGHVRHLGRPTPVFEFRHLTFQEYLAALALVDGRFPSRDRSQSLAQQVGCLAGQTSEMDDPRLAEDEEHDIVITENWHEPLRLCVALCSDDHVDNVLLAILNPLESEDSALTARPRTALAALCLADEPNVSDEIADKVLRQLIQQVGSKDGSGIFTSVDVAVKELAPSRWSGVLRQLLLDSFCSNPSHLRGSFGGLFSIATGSLIADNEASVAEWLTDRSADLTGEGNTSAIATALTIMDLAYDSRVVVVTEMASGLMSMLNASHPAAHAAAWALGWINRETLKAKAWRPTEAELMQIVEIIDEPSAEPETVEYLMWIVGRERFAPAVEPLLRKLDSADPMSRREAVIALGRIGDGRALERLIARLGDTDAGMQQAAASALGRMRDARAVEPLISKLHNSDKQTQRSVAFALGIIGDARGVEPLISLLDDSDKFLQHAAAHSLGEIGNARAIEYLTDRLSHSDGGTRELTQEVLESVAMREFNAGRTEKTAKIYETLVSNPASGKSFDLYRNNLAYCLMLLGRYEEAAVQFAMMEFSSRDPNWPLYQHNNGLLLFLMGNRDAGRRKLRESLRWIEEAGPGYDPRSVICMVILKGGHALVSKNAMPVDAAALLNLCAMEDTTIAQVTEDLSRLYPLESTHWITEFTLTGLGESATR